MDDQDIDLMLDITGKWQGEELPEDSILQNFVKYLKIVANFDAESSWCGSSYAVNQGLIFLYYTSKLGTYELAGKPNLPFSVSARHECPSECLVGWLGARKTNQTRCA